MMKLDYKISDEWNLTVDSDSLGAMDETDLRYGAFLGDFVMIANGKESRTDWGWVPLLDWFLALRHIRNELSPENDGVKTFEFTESDALIEFTKKGSSLTISPSYDSWLETVSFDEFSDAVDELGNRIFRDAASKHPQLLANEDFIRLSETAGQET
jgi:hypothetical protein